MTLHRAVNLDWQAQEAKERIRQAVADLLQKNALPVQLTARRNAIKSYGIGNATLDKNLELWHPNVLKSLCREEYHPVEQNSGGLDRLESLQEEEYHPIAPNKLLDLPAPAPHAQGAAETNHLAVGGSGGLSTGSSSDGVQDISDPEFAEASSSAPCEPGPALIREVLRRIEAEKHQAKERNHSELPLLDETYFGRGQERERNYSGYVQEKFVQQAFDLPGIDPFFPISVPTGGSRGILTDPNRRSQPTRSLTEPVKALLKAIEIEVNRLQWLPIQELIWIDQHFGGRSKSQLNVGDLEMLLDQLRRLT